MSVLVNVVDPLASALLTAAPPSTLSVTLPVTVPADELTVTVTVASALYVIVGALMLVDVAATATVCVNAVDVLPTKLPSPPYSAVMLWFPSASDDVVKVAWPDAFSVPVPSVVAPSLNVTVPVGTPPAEVTVAVNVTDPPGTEGFVLDV